MVLSSLLSADGPAAGPCGGPLAPALVADLARLHPHVFLQSILCGGILGLTIALPLGISRGLRSRFTNREIDLAAQALLQACDPTPLMARCQELQAVWARSRPRPLTNAVIQFNFARALEELGRVAEGERELDRLLPLYERYQSFMKLNIDLSAVSVKLKAGKPDEARSFLREGERHLRECRLAPHTAEVYRAALEQRRWYLRLMTEGGSPEALAYFRQGLSTDQPLLNQVSSHACLARCLLDLEQTEEARPHLEFVVAHGGKLATRDKARAELARLFPSDR